MSLEVEKWNTEQALLADKRHAPIIVAYRAGVPQHEIARRANRSKGWVSRVLKRARMRGLLEADKVRARI